MVLVIFNGSFVENRERIEGMAVSVFEGGGGGRC